MGITITEGVAFDEATHTYRHEGVVIPSASKISSAFDDSYSKVPPFVLQRKAELGTYVHAQSCFLDMGMDAEYTESSKPYLDAYKLFVDQFKPNPLEMEKCCIAFSDPMFGEIPYGMTFDRISEITFEDSRDPWLLDIKCTAAPHVESWCFQLAGYMNGIHRWPKYGDSIQRAGIVHLLKNGRCNFLEVDWQSYRVKFNAALLTYDHFDLGKKGKNA